MLLWTISESFHRCRLNALDAWWKQAPGKCLKILRAICNPRKFFTDQSVTTMAAPPVVTVVVLLERWLSYLATFKTNYLKSKRKWKWKKERRKKIEHTYLEEHLLTVFFLSSLLTLHFFSSVVPLFAMPLYMSGRNKNKIKLKKTKILKWVLGTEVKLERVDVFEESRMKKIVVTIYLCNFLYNKLKFYIKLQIWIDSIFFIFKYI